MRLYEVNEALFNLLQQLEPDPETGEITADADVILEQIDSLNLEKSRILEHLAKLVLNTRSDIAELKAEEKRLKERRAKLEEKESRIMDILDRECGGEKTDCGVATVSYRKTTKVDVKDNRLAIDWLEKQGYDTFIRYAEPEISKPDIKKLIQNGTEIPGIELLQDLSCSLK